MARLKLDHTGNEPFATTIGKIDVMLREQYAILLPATTLDKLDTGNNESLTRILQRVNARIAALHMMANITGRVPLDTTGNTPWLVTLALIDAQIGAIYDTPSTGVIGRAGSAAGVGAAFAIGDFVNSIRTLTGVSAGQGAATAVGSTVSGFTMPALSTSKYDGDSRTDNMGGYTNSAGTLVVTTGYGAANSSSGWIQAVLGNKYLTGQGYQHAIGASSTEAMMNRAQSTSNALTGNPANPLTGLAADAIYSRDSDATTTVLTQPGGMVVSASMSVNDTPTFYDTPTGGSGRPSATAIHSLENIGTYADNLLAAGKALMVGNEFPRGRSTYQMESKTVSGQTVTATNVNGFVDGESYGAPGVIAQTGTALPKRLTKVSSAPAQDQYTVSAGVVTFGGTAPTTAWLSYTAIPSGGIIATGVRQKIVNAWCNSAASSFVDPVNSVDYKLPGLKTRPNVIVADTFNALLDTTTGASLYPLPGTGDTLQLHHTQLGALKAAKAFKTAFDAAYPGAPSLDRKPTRNNWWVARGTGGGTTFTFTLPPTMRTAFTGGANAPTLVSINGAPVGKVDTTTGAITGTGITSGSLVFSTGVGTITFDAATRMPANAQLWLEQDIGNYDLTAMAEGTVGRNLLMNGLMDPTAAVGTNLATTTGATTITGLTASQIPYGWTLSSTALTTAIGNGTATISVASPTAADGFPQFAMSVEGTHTAGIGLALNNLCNSPLGRFTPGDKIGGGARVVYAAHPTNGGLYGSNGIENKVQLQTTAVSRPSPSGAQTVTFLSARTLDGSATAGSGLNLDNALLAEWGGPLDLYRAYSLIDTTGVSGGPTQSLLTVGTTANVPFAGQFIVGQAQIRRRADVAS